MGFLIYPIEQLNDILTYKVCGVQFILIWLFAAAVFLTIKMNFINFRLFKDAFKTIIGVGVQKNSEGKSVVQISPLTAFITQAAGNLGLGNIAGAAFALHAGGPGVLFWVFISSFFFSIIKFCEITLGHKYRYIDEKGSVNGGMFYIMRDGLKDKGKILAKFGKNLAIISATLTTVVILSWSFFQLNQVVVIITNGKHFYSENGFSGEVICCSIIMIFLAWLVLVGGIKRIGKLADAVVPIKALVYIGMCAIVIVKYHNNIIPSLEVILSEAFNTKGVLGGCAVSIVIAVQRMMFASEAGVGTAALVHANSNIKRSSQQGLIAIIDCILVAVIICIGGFAVVVSGIEYVDTHIVGIMLIDAVFMSVHHWFHYVLVVIAFLFGFTVITSNGYAVQKSLGYLFGTKKDKFYLYLFLSISLFMSFYESLVLIKIFDVLTLLILIPNTIIVYLLAGEVKEDLDLYLSEKKRGTGSISYN